MGIFKEHITSTDQQGHRAWRAWETYNFYTNHWTNPIPLIILICTINNWSLEFHNSPIIKMEVRHSSPYCSLTLNFSDIFRRIDFSAANPY